MCEGTPHHRTCLALLLERHKDEKADIEIDTFCTVFCTFLKRERNQTCAKGRASKVDGERTFRPGHIPAGMRTLKSFLIQNIIYVPKKKLPQAIKRKYNLLNS